MKKRLLGILAAVCICFSLSVPAFALGTCVDEHVYILGAGYCNGDGVNIRTGPGTNYPSVGMSYYGDAYNHYQCERYSSNWTHVHGVHIGWINLRYYTDVEAARTVEEAANAAQKEFAMYGEAAKNPYVYEVA